MMTQWTPETDSCGPQDGQSPDGGRQISMRGQMCDRTRSLDRGTGADEHEEIAGALGFFASERTDCP